MIDIPGYEGRYAVTSCGKVWSYKNKKFLKQSCRNKYLSVNLCNGKTNKSYSVHRLVALAYIDNPNRFPQVNHKDENKSNNCINNLEWCSAKYNVNYGTRGERTSEIRGKKVICIETGIIYKSTGEAARKTGINQALIHNCCSLKAKQAKGKHFFYLDYYYNHKDELKKTVKTVLVYCEQNNTYYENCKEAGDAFGIRNNAVWKVCVGEMKQTHGLTFKYVEKAVII